jgi:predicted nucleotidyltransferase
MERTYTIAEIGQKLQPIFDAAPVERAILFGSYAKGNPSKSSDADIVIDSKGQIQGIDFFGVIEDIARTLNIPVGVIEASQIIDGGRIQSEIAKTGVVIYEKA